MNDSITHRYVELDLDRWPGRDGPVTVSVRSWGRVGTEPVHRDTRTFENVTPTSLRRVQKTLGLNLSVLRPENIRVQATIRATFVSVEAYVKGRLD